MLSVATAPVEGRQRGVAIGVVFVMTAACFVLMPAAANALATNATVLPFLLGIAVASDFVTAYLLMSQFLASRLLGAAYLGGAYIAAGLGILGYLLTFPGVAGDVFPPQTAALMWDYWHLVFPAGVAVALAFDRQKRHAREKLSARRTMFAIVAASIGVSLAFFAFAVADGRSAGIVDGYTYVGGWRTIFGVVIVVVNLVALALAVIWTQGRTVLQTWLIVALVASVLDAQLSLTAGARFTLGWYVARGLVVVSSTAVLYAYLRQMHVLFGKLSDLSMIDGLTEIPNRRYFEARLHAAVRHAHRTHRALALVMIDVDHFKAYNDSYGHLSGDETLKAVAGALRNAAKRPGDVVARWGGEEFVVVLPETDHEGAYLVAERIRSAVAGLAIPHRGTSVRGNLVTISVGVALLGARDDDANALVERADEALYRAKDGGRNTVAVALAPPSSLRPAHDTSYDAILESLELES